MGSGIWTKEAFATYSTSTGRSLKTDGTLDGNWTAQEYFTQRNIHEDLNPRNVMRECVDSKEHPNTFPVILALDVTGSMGSSAVKIAKFLNVIMTDLYQSIPDVEFMIMGIGDLAYDYSPIQLTQFESDIRIAEQLDKIWFEGHGGGNSYESYTSAWYMGLHHTALDCWKRGKKGLIITIGDELINPYLPSIRLERATGDNLQGNIETSDLYLEAKEKFDIYHLVVCHNYSSEKNKDILAESFIKVLGENNVKIVNLDNISDEIVEIIKSEYNKRNSSEDIKPNNIVEPIGEFIW